MLSPLIAAIGFLGSAGMLAFAAAVAIPILIHLWSRRRHVEVRFAAMEFLMRAMRRHAKRIAFENWLLLVLRVAVLALLAFALADPLLSIGASGGSGTASAASRHWILVVDTSFSMSYREPTGTRLESARSEMINLVENAPIGDGFSIVDMGGSGEIVIGDPAFDKEDIQQQIREVEVTHQPARLVGTVGLIEEVIQQARRKRDQFRDTRVVFWSDLARNTWDFTFGDEGVRLFSRLAEKATIQLRDVGLTSEGNVAIVDVGLSASLPVPGSSVALQTQIEDFGSAAPRQATLSLYVDGRHITDRAVSIQPGQAVRETIQHQFARPGHRIVELRLSDDAIELDNRRHRIVSVSEQLRVLVMGERPESVEPLALALERNDALGRRVLVTRRISHQWVRSDFETTDVIFLNNVGQLRADQAELLHRFVREGGGLVVSMGDTVDVENWNRRLGGDAGVLPARLGEVKPSGDYRLDPLDYAHPLVDAFRGFPNSGLLSTPIWRYVQLQPAPEWEPPSRTALEFENGDSALVTRNVENGVVVLYAGSLTDDSIDRQQAEDGLWTAIIGWPSYVPMVQEMLLYALASDSNADEVFVGQPIRGSLPRAETDGLSMTTPDGNRLPVTSSNRAGRQEWLFTETNRAGVYQLRVGESTEVFQRFAVNVDPAESDASSLEPGQLPSNIEPVDEVAMGQIAEPEAEQTEAVYQYVLLALVVLLLVESAVAWRVGRPLVNSSQMPRPRS